MTDPTPTRPCPCGHDIVPVPVRHGKKVYMYLWPTRCPKCGGAVGPMKPVCGTASQEAA